MTATKEFCYFIEELEFKLGLILQFCVSGHSHLTMTPLPPFLPPQDTLHTVSTPTPNPSHISYPGPSSLWHFPSTQLTKPVHFLFIIYTNILNYFSSNPKYLFLIYGCKYKASRAHISREAIAVASRAFQI